MTRAELDTDVAPYPPGGPGTAGAGFRVTPRKPADQTTKEKR